VGKQVLRFVTGAATGAMASPLREDGSCLPRLKGESAAERASVSVFVRMAAPSPS